MDYFRNGKDVMEPWIETVNGNKFWYTGEDTSGIEIEDIAHALSNVCRYTGHCHSFYSVAEHSILVALLVPKHKRLWALLHDASEAYLADMASPVKQLLPEYKALEHRIMVRIAKKFGLPDRFWEDKDIKQADWAQLKAEAKVLLPSGGKDWYFPDTVGTGLEPNCISSNQAKMEFIDFYQDCLDRL